MYCGVHTDGAARLAAAELNLCAECAASLATGLLRLPELYRDCERALHAGAQTGLRERVSGGPLPGLAFNEAAADVRQAMLRTLASWSGLVVEQREVHAPRRDVAGLCEFLLRHLRWLAAHPAGPELSKEVARLVKAANRIIDSSPHPRIPIGPCPRTGCGGTLVASVSGVRGTARPDGATIQCDADPQHQWAGRQRSELVRGTTGKPLPERWLTAQELAWMWEAPVGTVYRLASEQHWRRRSRAGRVHCAQADAEKAFARRADRLAAPGAASADVG